MRKLPNYDSNNKSNNFKIENDKNLVQTNAETANGVDESNLEITKRSLKFLHKTEGHGIDCATNLDEQGEKLKDCVRKVDEIDYTLSRTQENIRKMSLFGDLKSRFMNWRSGASVSNNSLTITEKSEQQSQIKQDTSLQKQQFVDRQKKQELVKKTGLDTEDKFNQNIDLMSESISQIKKQGIAIENELKKQKSLTDRLKIQMPITDDKMKKQIEQMKRVKK